MLLGLCGNFKSYVNIWNIHVLYLPFSFEGSVLRSSIGHRATVLSIKAATAPAVSFRASYRLPINDKPANMSFRRDSRVIGVSPHQGKLWIQENIRTL